MNGVLRFTTRGGIAAGLVPGGPKLPLLLVHGQFGDASTWDRFLPLLRWQRPVCVLDLPWHGGSTLHPQLGSAACLTEAVREVLGAVGWHRCAAVGFSAGARPLLHAALAEPGRLVSLMLASVPGDLSLEMRDRFRGLGDMVGGGFTLPLATVATEMWYAPAYRAAHPELPAETLALLRRNDPAAQRACCMALAGEEDLRGRLGGLGIPVTFLFGRQDGVAPRSAAGHLVEETRGTVVELDTGHFPQDEDPHGFSDALLAFLEAVDRMAPASPA